MKLRVNAQDREVDAGTTVAALVTQVTGKADPPGVAVALNGRVVTRSRWPETALGEGDQLELVNAVQGG